MSDPSRPPLGPCVLAASLVLALPSKAQDAPQPGEVEGQVEAAAVRTALLGWVSAYESGSILVDESTVVSHRSSAAYVRQAVSDGVFVAPKRGKSGQVSHFALLQRLVSAAESHPSAAATEGLLAVASSGLATDMFNHQRLAIRDLGHFALMRMDAAVVWQTIFQIADTELVQKTEKGLVPLPAGIDIQSDFDLDVRTMWRVAAIRLLGMKAKTVFRRSIESALRCPDSRVRLAAAESVGFMHKAASLPVVTAAVATEDHPMVVVGLVQAIQKILNKHVEDIDAAVTEEALRTALTRLNQVDWRTDMAVVQLIHNFPIKAAVEPFIRLMRQSRGEVDPILKIINKNASLFLGGEAHRALRRITGAMVPPEPEKWEEFWGKNQADVVVRRRSPADKSKTYAAPRTGGFYGIPVLGNDVVFVLDTSGSMKARVEAKIPKTGTRSGGKKTMRGSRLQIAKHQTLKAIQGMPRNSKFSIVSFDGRVHAWNRTPVAARSGARATAARILGGLRPKGGTNVFDALIHVLEARGVAYGEKPSSDVDEVFVLSDGQPSGGVLNDPAEILRVVQEINKVRKIRIHTVFAGSGAGSDFMRKLAEENGGKFVQQ